MLVACSHLAIPRGVMSFRRRKNLKVTEKVTLELGQKKGGFIVNEATVTITRVTGLGTQFHNSHCKSLDLFPSLSSPKTNIAPLLFHFGGSLLTKCFLTKPNPS